MSGAKQKRDLPASFEERIERLEQIVASLEQGEAPLEESLQLFEEGIELARACQGQLEEAKERVQVLLKAAEDGTIETEPFIDGEESRGERDG